MGFRILYELYLLPLHSFILVIDTYFNYYVQIISHSIVIILNAGTPVSLNGRIFTTNVDNVEEERYISR